MIRRLGGFTLIELLISIAMGLVLMGVISSALVTFSNVAKRDRAQRQAHDDANVIYHRLKNRLGGVHNPCQLRLERPYELDGSVYGEGDTAITNKEYLDGISLTWMSSLSSLKGGEMGYKPWRRTELVWNKMEWKPKKDGSGRIVGGTLRYAISSAGREVTDYTYDGNNPLISVTPASRKSRLRDPNDNDMRFVNEITSATWQAIGMAGDMADLDNHVMPMHPPTTEVRSFRISWVDVDGYTTIGDINGISVNNVSKALIPDPHVPGTGVLFSGSNLIHNEYSTENAHVLSGLVTTGSLRTKFVEPDTATRHAYQQRPALVRIEMTLVPKSGSAVDIDEEPHFDFTFTFPTSPKLPYRR